MCRLANAEEYSGSQLVKREKFLLKLSQKSLKKDINASRKIVTYKVNSLSIRNYQWTKQKNKFHFAANGVTFINVLHAKQTKLNQSNPNCQSTYTHTCRWEDEFDIIFFFCDE